MLDSGDNEFAYRGCKEATEKGIAKFTIKELQKGFSEQEIQEFENKIMNEIEKEQLRMEIQHIFDSGANEIRIFEMVKRFIESRNGANKLPIQGVSNIRELFIDLLTSLEKGGGNRFVSKEWIADNYLQDN